MLYFSINLGKKRINKGYRQYIEQWCNRTGSTDLNFVSFSLIPCKKENVLRGTFSIVFFLPLKLHFFKLALRSLHLQKLQMTLMNFRLYISYVNICVLIISYWDKIKTMRFRHADVLVFKSCYTTCLVDNLFALSYIT